MWYILNFFTTWITILVFFHRYVHQYILLPFVTYIVMIVGLYFSYINPGHFIIINDDQKIIVRDPYKFIFIDLPFHIFTFLFIYKLYGLHNKFDMKIINVLLILILYAIMSKPSEIYQVHISEIIVVTVCAIVSYILLCNMSK
jgi:hypothetical protein